MIQRNVLWFLITTVIGPVMLSQISVIGFIIYLLGVPICWRFKSQKQGEGRALHFQAVRLNTWQSLRQSSKFALFIIC
jgi:hypothetical protein